MKATPQKNVEIDTGISEEGIARLTKDLKRAVEKLTPHEVRFLVDTYYSLQENRKAAANQVRALNESKEEHAVIDWLTNNSLYLEKQVKAALNAYAEKQLMGQWARSHYGIGPVIAAGLLAHIDIEKAPTYGHVWSYAGLTTGFNMPVKWEKGQKRPWNASLKTLAWKIGDSFVKFSGQEECFYGKEYVVYKLVLLQKNDRGDFIPAALVGADRVGKTTEAWQWYAGCYPAGASYALAKLADQKAKAEWLKTNKVKPGEGQAMLPPGHIDARARRYTAKLFLSHWWAEAFMQRYGKRPPSPYPIAHQGHAHEIQSPVPSLARMKE